MLDAKGMFIRFFIHLKSLIISLKFSWDNMFFLYKLSTTEDLFTPDIIMCKKSLCFTGDGEVGVPLN